VESMLLLPRTFPAIAILFSSACLFGQTPPEFEVASVKPSGPLAPGQMAIGVHIDGAQVSISQFSLKDLVQMAYQLKIYQVTGPEWIASERYTIRAKIPEGVVSPDVRAMVRSLLAERFHLKIHMEKKDFPVYALVAAKGGARLTPSAADAGPDADAGAVHVAAGGSEKGTFVNLGHGSSFSFAGDKLEATKITMLAFTDTLARFTDKPVVDMTGLAGNYDLTMKLSPEDFRAMQIRAAIVAGVQLPPQAIQLAESASLETLHASLRDLGLKLDSRKAPLDVIVVDSADKLPAEN